MVHEHAAKRGVLAPGRRARQHLAHHVPDQAAASAIGLRWRCVHVRRMSEIHTHALKLPTQSCGQRPMDMNGVT